jgi:hypothetical protein
MKAGQRLLLALLGCALVGCFLAASVFGQTPPAAPPESPVQAARKAVLDARAALAKVQDQVAQIRLRVLKTFESRDDFAAAKKAVDDAQAEYEAALKPVMAALYANPDYQQLVAKRKAAQAVLDASHTQHTSPGDSDISSAQQDDAISQAAGEVLTDGFAINKMETDAKENDLKLATAQEKLNDAKQQMAALQTQVDAALQNDPEYQQVQPTLAAAQQQVTSAVAAFIQAQKAARPAPTANRSSNAGRSGE